MSKTIAGKLLAKMESSIDAELGLRVPNQWTLQNGEAGQDERKYVYARVNPTDDQKGQAIVVVPDGNGGYNFGASKDDGATFDSQYVDSLVDLQGAVDGLIDAFDA